MSQNDALLKLMRRALLHTDSSNRIAIGAFCAAVQSMDDEARKRFLDRAIAALVVAVAESAATRARN
jgi:hypothetical protein